MVLPCYTLTLGSGSFLVFATCSTLSLIQRSQKYRIKWEGRGNSLNQLFFIFQTYREKEDVMVTRRVVGWVEWVIDKKSQVSYSLLFTDNVRKRCCCVKLPDEKSSLSLSSPLWLRRETDDVDDDDDDDDEGSSNSCLWVSLSNLRECLSSAPRNVSKNTKNSNSKNREMEMNKM